MNHMICFRGCLTCYSRTFSLWPLLCSVSTLQCSAAISTITYNQRWRQRHVMRLQRIKQGSQVCTCPGKSGRLPSVVGCAAQEHFHYDGTSSTDFQWASQISSNGFGWFWPLWSRSNSEFQYGTYYMLICSAKHQTLLKTRMLDMLNRFLRSLRPTVKPSSSLMFDQRFFTFPRLLLACFRGRCEPGFWWWIQ